MMSVSHAGNILGLDIKGHITRQILITPASDIAEEYYVSFLLDRSNRTFLAMATREGGMEIEQLAEERPEALAKIPVNALTGIDAAKAAEIADAGKFPAEVREQIIAILVGLWDTFVSEDATLVEVNPLVKDEDGTVRRAGRQGLPRRERRLPSPGPRSPRGQLRGEPARGAGEGKGPELRQARRPGRQSSATVRAW